MNAYDVMLLLIAYVQPTGHTAYQSHLCTESVLFSLYIHNHFIRFKDDGGVLSLVVLDLNTAFDIADNDVVLR